MKEGIVDVFQKFLDSNFENIHTTIPGKIEKYNESDRKATVTPLVTLKTKDGDDLEIPTIDDVPVVFPSSGKFSLTFPLQRGDLCLIIFAEAGIGTWLSGSGDLASADSASRFSLQDAICLPGLWTFSSVPDSDSGLRIADKFALWNLLQDQYALINKLFDEIVAIKTTGSPVSHILDPSTIAAFEALRIQYNQLWEAK